MTDNEKSRKEIYKKREFARGDIAKAIKEFPGYVENDEDFEKLVNEMQKALDLAKTTL